MRPMRHAFVVLACLATPFAALAQGNTGQAGNPEHDARGGHYSPEMVVPQPNRPAAPPTTGTPMSPQESQEALRHLERNEQAGAPQLRVRELELVSPGGDKLGKVEDVMLDGEGQLAGYVVETGGVLGIGARHVFVPREAARLEREADGRAVLRTSQQIGSFVEASRARAQ